MRPSSKRKMSKPILGPKKYAYGVHLGSLGKILQTGESSSETGEAVGHGEVVLGVVLCIDVGNGLACTGLNSLQKGCHLFFLSFHDI